MKVFKNKKEIYSEHPELEEWSLIEIYSYPNNIMKYFEKMAWKIRQMKK